MIMMVSRRNGTFAGGGGPGLCNTPRVTTFTLTDGSVVTVSIIAGSNGAVVRFTLQYDSSASTGASASWCNCSPRTKRHFLHRRHWLQLDPRCQ